MKIKNRTSWFPKMLRSAIFLIFIGFVISDESPIKNVLVLMMENRAFDHVLGYLKQLDPKYDGLTGAEFNQVDPQDPRSAKVKVHFDAPNRLRIDPSHSVSGTAFELYGKPFDRSAKPFPKVEMSGFLAQPGDANLNPLVMSAYNSSSLPGFYTLATQFAVLDRFHASIPGPTEVNRMFLLSGQSDGAATNVVPQLIAGYPQRTFFQDLEAANKTWAVYVGDFPTAFFLRNNRDYPDHFKDMTEYYEDAFYGRLPEFSFLEPRYFDFLDWLEQDQHPRTQSLDKPSSSIGLGEALIRDLYVALRKSPQWTQSLLFITYDEHGGLYDHVPPPQTDVPPPNNKVSTDPPFAFDRLGVRVPAVAVSAWLDPGTVEHEPATGSHYDHTSVLHTARRILNLPSPPLTDREAWAAPFDHLFTVRQTPRTDAPVDLPTGPFPPQADHDPGVQEAHGRGRLPETPQRVAAALKRAGGLDAARAAAGPITDFQASLVHAAFGLAAADDRYPLSRDQRHDLTVEWEQALANEFDAARFVRKQYKEFKERSK